MRKVILANLLVVAFFTAAVAQQPSPTSSMVGELLVRFESADRAERKQAFNDVLRLASGKENPTEMSGVREAITNFLTRNPGQADAVRLGLIHLLSLENSKIYIASRTNAQNATQESPEAKPKEDEYYPTLIAAVTALRDERAIRALLGATPTGGMAMRAVAEFGDKALGSVLEQAKSPDPIVRSSALFTVRNMLRMKTLNLPTSQIQITSAIQESLQDSNFAVRSSAISVIEYMDNRQEFVPALQKLAESDPVRVQESADEGGDLYPVRRKARRVLREIDENRQPVGASTVR
jgi:hypothetical protein